jgi:hypothetical protein
MAPGCARAPRAGARRPAAATLDRGPGRLEQRRLPTRAGVAGASAWPGCAHGWRWARPVMSTKTGAGRAAVVAGVTRLPPERADAARWRALVCGPWQLAPQAHGVREVPVEAERAQVQCGPIPQVRAARRQTVMGLRRWAG